MKIIPSNFVSRAIEAQQILLDKFMEEEDPIKKEQLMIEAMSSPVALPAKAIVIGTAGGAAIGWIAEGKIVKYFTKEQVSDIAKIKKELIKSHNPQQADLYKQITDLQEVTKKNAKGTNRWQKGAFYASNPIIKVISKLVGNIKETEGKSKEKYLAILIRKYEDSLNNYQLSVYKTLFEAQYRVMNKSKVISLITVLGSTLIGAGIAITSTLDKDKQIKAYLKANKK